MTVEVEDEAGRGVREDVLAAARVLATVSLVGALAGAVVVGVLGRLAMMLLAVLNPENAGVTSDDGFTMGQFTLSGSLQLLASGIQFGLVGVGFYVVLRGLMVGPPWFRLLSISVGPAVVVGAGLVHTDGVDFTLLQPLWLTVVLFVALPGLYVALLHLGAERALASPRPLPTPLLVVGLLPWVVVLPVTLLLLAGFLALRAVRRSPSLQPLVRPGAWAARGALTVLFALAVVDLVRDVDTLSGIH